MKKLLQRLIVGLVVSNVSSFCNGSVAYIIAGQTVNQNFNGLNSSGADWSDDTTLTGWYARTDSTATITTYGASSGGTTTPAGLYGFGPNANSDRALGFLPSNAFTGGSGTGLGYIGIQINNGTGGDLTQFTIGYTGEQWRRDNASAHSIAVQYKFGATAINDASGWNTISSLQFTSPQLSATALALDGNAAANRTVFSPATVNSTWASGQDLWIRWIDLNDSGNDHHMAVDDFSFTAVPEPTTWAGIIFGALFCGVQVVRRWRAVRGQPSAQA